MFGVSPVDFVGERRVWEIRDELLPCRVFPSRIVNGRGWKERRHWNEFSVETVQREVIRDIQDEIHFLGVDFEEGVPRGDGRGELENSLLARETEEGRGRTFGDAGGKKEIIILIMDGWAHLFRVSAVDRFDR